MKHYLLLGAGFSRNWGGWLATEVFEYLLGCPQIANHEGLKNLMWDHRLNGGFEGVLSHLQNEVARRRGSSIDEQLIRFTEALTQMFEDMNGVFDDPNLGVGNSVCDFLAHFDAVFTLNQDLLLERHYLASGNFHLYAQGKWGGCIMPGIRSLADTRRAIMLGRFSECRWEIGDKTDFPKSEQPYFKLHGSSNWADSSGNPLLIMGGNKSRAIQSSPTLTWYHGHFAQLLKDGDSRLMVIGYGFGDVHINSAILDAKESGLRIFVVDPNGADVVNTTRDAPIRAREPLEELIIGASRRRLTDTLSYDGVERKKLMRFFEV